MSFKDNILVTGGSGLVGNAIRKMSSEYDLYNWIFLRSKDCDLTSYEFTDKLFEKINPKYVIHLAAKVGGLFKNMSQKSDMFESNILINMNVLRCCKKYNVKKIVSCLSTCVFPDNITHPINETMLHNGEPHCSNEGYAYAKRMLEVQSKIYREQFGINAICVMPTNVYGENDNYNLKDAHVIPALIHKCYLSKLSNNMFTVYGSGKPLRQFIYSRDLANLIIWSLFNYSDNGNLILAPDELSEVSIEKIANLIAKEFDYENKIVFDSSMNDGQYKKTVSNDRLRKYLPDYEFISIEKGIKKTVKWFIDNYTNIRK